MTQEIFAGLSMTLVLGALGWGLNRFNFKEDERKIVQYLLQCARGRGERYISTEAIALGTLMEIERVSEVCGRSSRILHDGKLGSWGLAE